MGRNLPRVPGWFFPLLLWTLVPTLMRAQEGMPPEFLRARALVVRFLAVSGDTSPQVSSAPGSKSGTVPLQAGAATALQAPGPAWTSRSHRYTVFGSPVGIRLAGDKLVVIVQVTPYEHGKEGLVVVAQGQVWSRQENNEIAYRNVFETLPVAYGERVFFYPLGMNTDGSAAIRLEIAVDHFGDPPSLPEDDAERRAKDAQGVNHPGTGVPGGNQPVKRSQ